MASWWSLDRFLTSLDFSRKLLAYSWLISLIPKIGKSAQEFYLLFTSIYLFTTHGLDCPIQPKAVHQEANKKTSRSCPRRKKCQEVSRSVKKKTKRQEISKQLRKFLVLPDRSRIPKKWYKVNKEVSTKPSRMIKNLSSARFLFKFVNVHYITCITFCNQA